jgi:hypothetical protein
MDRVGRDVSLHAWVLARGAPLPPGLRVVADPGRADPPVRSVAVESRDRGGPRFAAVVHGYGCSCAEEVELWEAAGLVLVGVGQAVTLLDARTGAVRARFAMGGYFNAMHLPDDGRDAYLCGDEVLVRLVPPGAVSWVKSLGMDGVLVHRAVGLTVFVSAQRKVGGPWVDFLLDRTTGKVVEAPEPDEEELADAAKARATAKAPPRSPAPLKPAPAAPAAPKETPPKTDTASPPPGDEDAVRVVRDDETDPDDE